MNLEIRDTSTFCTYLTKKERGSIYANVTWQLPKKEWISFYGNVTWQWPRNDAYISNEMQLQNHSLAFIQKNESLLSATSILSCSPMAYNTIATSGKLPCTDYVDFGNCQERFGRVSWYKNDSNYLDVKLKVFKWEDKNAEFRLKQNFTIGEADFNQFIRERNQQVVAADNFLREQKLSPLLQYTLSKDMEQQLKLVHKVTDVVFCPSSSVWTEDGGRKVPANCVCQQ